MLKIRLKRVGRKHDASFRVIVTPAGSSITSGKYVDQIGFYDPRTNTKEIDKEKAAKWLNDGAQPTDTVFNLLVDAGVIDARKKNVLPQKSPVGVEASQESEATADDTTSEASETNEPSDSEPVDDSSAATEETSEEPAKDAEVADDETAEEVKDSE